MVRRSNMPNTPKPKMYTQAQVDAAIRKAMKDAKNPVPNKAKMAKMSKMQKEADMDKKMKAAAKRNYKNR